MERKLDKGESEAACFGGLCEICGRIDITLRPCLGTHTPQFIFAVLYYVHYDRMTYYVISDAYSRPNARF